VSEFDEFKKEFGIDDSPYSAEHYIIEPSFKAGQQSQQGEVNKLQTKIDLLEKEITETQTFLNKQNRIKQAKIDELQARIDEALHAADESCGVSVAAFVKLNRILKGNKDEN